MIGISNLPLHLTRSLRTSSDIWNTIGVHILDSILLNDVLIKKNFLNSEFVDHFELIITSNSKIFPSFIYHFFLPAQILIPQSWLQNRFQYLWSVKQRGKNGFGCFLMFNKNIF